jgi:hypothetical protein
MSSSFNQNQYLCTSKVKTNEQHRTISSWCDIVIVIVIESGNMFNGLTYLRWPEWALVSTSQVYVRGLSWLDWLSEVTQSFQTYKVSRNQHTVVRARPDLSELVPFYSTESTTDLNFEALRVLLEQHLSFPSFQCVSLFSSMWFKSFTQLV